jgi:hypothetical protein
MSDYQGIAFRLLVDSTALHVRPNTTVEIYTAGTSSLIWSGSSDADGVYSVATLATGHYDVKVDGVTVESFHHVDADHVHSADEDFTFYKLGAITGDEDESINQATFCPGVAGSVIKIEVTAITDATGDVTPHLLRGAAGGASALTVSSDSVWSHQENPTSAVYRYKHTDESPSLTLSASQALTLGINWTASAVGGLAVKVTFRPD